MFKQTCHVILSNKKGRIASVPPFLNAADDKIDIILESLPVLFPFQQLPAWF